MRRLALIAALILLTASQARATVPGDACTGAQANQFGLSSLNPNTGFENGLFCNGSTWQSVINFQSTGNVGIGTTAPAAPLHVKGEAILGMKALGCSGTTAGALRYNSSINYIEFCNGTVWAAMIAQQSTTPPTAPSGSGYFVMTQTQWNGNLGGLAGANAKCLSELTTTHTGWAGHSTANSNGQLIASKVKAFLCDGSTCTNLMPLTTYYFADANNAGNGGASFTTDASGLGPNDSVSWAAANRFGGTYNYWLHRTSTGSTQWSNTSQSGGFQYGCNVWTNATNGDGASAGVSTYSDANRWVGITGGSAQNCDNTYNLICMVNP